MYGDAAQDALIERCDDLVAILQRTALKTAQRAAVLLGDDHVVGDVDQTTGKVSGIGRLHSGIGKSLTRTVRRNEVLQHGHTLLEVGDDRVLDDLRTLGTSLLRLCHQTTHTGELGNLVGRTTRTGVEHHIYGVEALVVFGHVLHHGSLQVGIDVRPGIDDLIVTLLVGDETHIVVVRDLVDFLLTLGHDAVLLLRHDDIVKVEGETGNIGHVVTEVLDTVEEGAGAGHVHGLDYISDQSTQ